MWAHEYIDIRTHTYCMHTDTHMYILMAGCSRKIGEDSEQAATSCRTHDDTTSSSIPHFSSSEQGTRPIHKQSQ